MSKPTMSELLAQYNELALAKGKEQVTSFKNLAAARAAVINLESQTMITEDNPLDDVTSTVDATDADAPVSKNNQNYNSAKKRGPTQGIGAFCKGLITEGKTNAEILEAVAAQFPTAKTTANCVAYYRAKMKLATKAPVAEEAEVTVEDEALV